MKREDMPIRAYTGMSAASPSIAFHENNLILAALNLAETASHRDLKALRVAALKYAEELLLGGRGGGSTARLVRDEESRCEVHGFRGCSMGC
jgi:hypothetical protein